jgi:hypothetical protein
VPLVDGGGNPYPSINDVMDAARSRVNDMMNDVSGDLLSNDAPYAQTFLTSAWKWYQARCDTAGVQTFIKSVMLYGIPARSNDDVGNESWITWTGCSDGVFQYEGPVLPPDMISPKSIWRRRSVPLNSDGTQAVNQNPLELTTQAVDGLPVYLDPNVTDWREDGIYFYGANYAQDWKFRYSAYRAPLDITQPNNLVPMMMCEDCLGARVAFEFANARGATQAPAMEAWAETAFNTTSQRATRIKQRQSIRRQGYSQGSGHSNHRYPGPQ